MRPGYEHGPAGCPCPRNQCPFREWNQHRSGFTVPHAGQHAVRYFQEKLQGRHHSPEQGTLPVGIFHS